MKVIKLINIDSDNLEIYKKDILLNKSLINISKNNMYEILFNTTNFDYLLNIVLENIKKQTNDNFDVFIKNMWGYIRNDDDLIKFDVPIKDELSIKPKYSFVYVIDSEETSIYIKNEIGVVEKFNLKIGELLIFETNNFIEEICNDKHRIILTGSITNDLTEYEIEKKLL
jgi:hypothetical protein